MQLSLKYGWLFLMIILMTPAKSQTFQFEDQRSKVLFHLKNFGLQVEGRLIGLSGVYVFADSVEKSYFKATVEAKTIDTGIPLRDKHLRKETYFDAEKYPAISIASNRIYKQDDHWVAEARLTIKNTTKSILIPFTMEKSLLRVTLKSNFTVNRLDYNVGGKSFSMDDNVEVQLEVVGRILND